MKERPILFSGPMVRAILVGSKTQTRRVIKTGALKCPPYFFSGETRNNLGYPASRGHVWAGFRHDPEWEARPEPRGSASYFKCPYGQPGDRLWVRETWSSDFAHHYPNDRVWYAADDARQHSIEVTNGVRGIYSPESKVHVPFRWHPSIHMPRWASRITLEVVSVQVERLQEISAFDALAEGCPYHQATGFSPSDAIQWYQQLWDSINGKPKPGKPDVAWAANPWVWVVEFKRGEGRAV